MMRPVLLAVLLSGSALAQTVPGGPSSSGDESAERARQVDRVQEIFRLGASKQAKDQATFFRILSGAVSPWERLAAIKSLRPAHQAEAIVPLQTLIDDADPYVALEATVALHRFRPTPTTLSRLDGLRGRGARLRGAFQTGESHGRPTYTEGAVAFFEKSAAHALLETRLDGALGLVELGGHSREHGLKVLRQTLESSDPGVRRTLVRVLNVQYDESAFIPMLEQATRDPDESIRTIAGNILANRR